MNRLIAAFLLTWAPWVVWADGLESLEVFLRTTTSGRAEFTQVVTAPARDGQGVRNKTSSGIFEFVRPGRFRFDYRKPFAQQLVADGQTLWLYDADLNQVTARRQAQALAGTPAALIASAADLRALQVDYLLTSQPERDGLQWVLATPRARDGPMQSVRVGLRTTGKSVAGGVELAVLEILDSLGQRSTLSFSRVELNLPLPADTFQFKPPKGADLIRP